jgi:phosphatidylserine/phosphatidylglycerophosphate/cardiolipin synthase-like enzyme
MKRLWQYAFIAIICMPLYCFSSEIYVGFSPGGQAQQLVLSVIDNTQKTLDVAAYSFTSKPIAQAIVAADKRGVEVRVMVDEKANSERYSAVNYLANQRVNVRKNSNYAIMHNKFIIADGINVETGSFNYTAAANKSNAENALLIANDPQLASQYHKEFNRLWDESTPIKKSH